jgi:hypothetical protein
LHGLATGSCRGLGASVTRAWLGPRPRLDPAWADSVARRCGAYAVHKPLLVAPAMNTAMWHQRATQVRSFFFFSCSLSFSLSHGFLCRIRLH